jgi:Valyl-tRNA synthetase
MNEDALANHKSIMFERVPEAKQYDNELLLNFETVKEVIGGVRTIRLQRNIAQKEPLTLQILGNDLLEAFYVAITKMCNLSAIDMVDAKVDGAASFIVGTIEYAVPLGNLIDTEAELAKLEADLNYQEGFLASVLKKLSNEKFVGKAPAAVIEMERKKQADAESIINSLKESIEGLKKAQEC